MQHYKLNNNTQTWNQISSYKQYLNASPEISVIDETKFNSKTPPYNRDVFIKYASSLIELQPQMSKFLRQPIYEESQLIDPPQSLIQKYQNLRYYQQCRQILTEPVKNIEINFKGKSMISQQFLLQEGIQKLEIFRKNYLLKGLNPIQQGSETLIELLNITSEQTLKLEQMNFIKNAFQKMKWNYFQKASFILKNSLHKIENNKFISQSLNKLKITRTNGVEQIAGFLTFKILQILSDGFQSLKKMYKSTTSPRYNNKNFSSSQKKIILTSNYHEDNLDYFNQRETNSEILNCFSSKNKTKILRRFQSNQQLHNTELALNNNNNQVYPSNEQSRRIIQQNLMTKNMKKSPHKLIFNHSKKSPSLKFKTSIHRIQSFDDNSTKFSDLRNFSDPADLEVSSEQKFIPNVKTINSLKLNTNGNLLNQSLNFNCLSIQQSNCLKLKSTQQKKCLKVRTNLDEQPIYAKFQQNHRKNKKQTMVKTYHLISDNCQKNMNSSDQNTSIHAIQINPFNTHSSRNFSSYDNQNNMIGNKYTNQLSKYLNSHQKHEYSKKSLQSNDLYNFNHYYRNSFHEQKHSRQKGISIMSPRHATHSSSKISIESKSLRRSKIFPIDQNNRLNSVKSSNIHTAVSSSKIFEPSSKQKLMKPESKIFKQRPSKITTQNNYSPNKVQSIIINEVGLHNLHGSNQEGNYGIFSQNIVSNSIPNKILGQGRSMKRLSNYHERSQLSLESNRSSNASHEKLSNYFSPSTLRYKPVKSSQKLSIIPSPQSTFQKPLQTPLQSSTQYQMKRGIRIIKQKDVIQNGRPKSKSKGLLTLTNKFFPQ